MFALRYSAVLVLVVAVLVGVFVWFTNGGGNRFAFKLGLDLSGGTAPRLQRRHFQAPRPKSQDAMQALQTVIERRVNAFGVGEPVVQTQQGGALGNGGYRLIVELPG
jgi:preprotein translocase subunit SecD